MDKKFVVHIHNGILLSYKKNASESVLMRWMKLEPIIQREVRKKTPIQYIKDGINDPICKIAKENRLLDSVGKGKGGMI